MDNTVYNENNNKIAVFIDAENVSYKNAKRVIEVLEKKGRILVREIVADWTKINVTNKNKDDNISGWRSVAAISSMTAVQQFTYRPKKNSSDIALAIRAMKCLYEKPYIDMYCIVSNDCDFTRLAQELREQDKFVIGMGEQSKSIDEFVKAFSEYIYLDEIMEENGTSDESLEHVAILKSCDTNSASKNRKEKEEIKDGEILEEEKMSYLVEVIQELIDEKGLALYCAINGPVKNKFPDFVPQNFNCKNFRQLMEVLLPHLKQFEKIQTNDDFALIEKKT